MPQRSLTPEQKKQVHAWLQDKWKGNANCSVCLSNNWNIGGDIVTPTIFVDGGISIGGGAYPQVMSICGNCGHTVYFNAMVMGIVENPKDDKEQKEATASGGENG